MRPLAWLQQKCSHAHVAIAFLICCALGATQASAEVVILGSGTPNPDPDRSGPSVAIIANGRAYLVDCGPGVVRRAEAAALAGVSALETRNLTTVFITHLHSDHTLGLPDLIFTPWVVGRSQDRKSTV